MYLSSQLKKKKMVCVTLELVLWCWNTRMERAREIGRLSLRSSFCGWWFEGPLSSICVICNLFGCERDPGQRSRPASEILTCPLTEMDTLSFWHLSESSSAFKAEWCAHQKHFPCYVGAEVLNQGALGVPSLEWFWSMTMEVLLSLQLKLLIICHRHGLKSVCVVSRRVCRQEAGVFTWFNTEPGVSWAGFSGETVSRHPGDLNFVYSCESKPRICSAFYLHLL